MKTKKFDVGECKMLNGKESKFINEILSWSDFKFKKEVEIAANTPIADWFSLSVLSAKFCATNEEAERVFFDILTRSRRADSLLSL